jgi:TonB family protein
MRSTWLGLALLTLSVGVRFASAVDTVADADAAMMAKLNQAEIASTLEDVRLKPWHLKLSFQLFDAQKKPTDQGTIEEWWSSPTLYKIAYTSPLYTSVDIKNANGFFRTKRAGLPPVSVEILRGMVIHPMPSQLDVSRSKAKFILQPFGKTQLDCIMLEPIDNKTKVPLGLFPTYCMDHDTSSFRVFFGLGSPMMVRNRVGRFQEREVAIDQTASLNNSVVSTAHVESLQNLVEDAAEYVPSPEMSKVAGQIPRVSSGVSAGLLATQVKPIYPQRARDNHAQGTVILSATISREGRVISVRPIQVPDADLAIAAMQAVLVWTYKPYILNGEPTAINTTITVNFGFQP